jgi:dUTP pyrophosphatase
MTSFSDLLDDVDLCSFMGDVAYFFGSVWARTCALVARLMAHVMTYVRGYVRLDIMIVNPLANQYYSFADAKMNTAYDGDSGLDLYIIESVHFAPGESKKIPLGIACKATYVRGPRPFCWGTGYDIRPRSSISNGPLRLSNSVGTIDAGYRGELMLALDNIKPAEYTLPAGTRITQIVANHTSLRPRIVTKLDSTARGSGGFGSSGK